MNLNARNQQQKSRPYQSLADILANDSNGLLANVTARHLQSTDNNLVSQFQEINEFVKKFGEKRHINYVQSTGPWYI